MGVLFRMFTRWQHLGVSPLLRLAQGALLGMGAPLGWHLLRYLFDLTVDHPSYEVVLDGYMVLGTMFVLSCFGYLIGKKEEAFAEQSLIDGLTSLYNARQFQITLNKELARAERLHAPLSMLMVDIDFFKHVNDTFGHPAGDVVLATVAHELVSQVREADTVARVGGEEFAVLLPGISQERAVGIAERMRIAVSELYIQLPVGTSIQVKVSAGVATIELHDRLPKEPSAESTDELTGGLPDGSRGAIVSVSESGKVCGGHGKAVGQAAFEATGNAAGAVGNNPKRAMSARLLYSSADEALYAAKRNGRNQVAVSDILHVERCDTAK